MSLRNTDFIYGVVIFTGHETKVMKNSAQAKYKKSRLDLFTDKTVKYLFLAQLLLTFIIGLIAYPLIANQYDSYRDDSCKTNAEAKCAGDEDFDHCVEEERNMCRSAYYLEIREKPDFGTVIKITCTWILLFVNLVPISLMISLEMVKLFQAAFMSMDCMMFDQAEQMPMRA